MCDTYSDLDVKQQISKAWENPIKFDFSPITSSYKEKTKTNYLSPITKMRFNQKLWLGIE